MGTKFDLDGKPCPVRLKRGAFADILTFLPSNDIQMKSFLKDHPAILTYLHVKSMLCNTWTEWLIETFGLSKQQLCYHNHTTSNLHK